MSSITEVIFATLFQGKGKGKGKGKKTWSETEEKKKTEVKIEDWPQNHKKLRSLDVFAGCGGMSSYLAVLYYCVELMKRLPLEMRDES
jgi:hypothetical protein